MVSKLIMDKIFSHNCKMYYSSGIVVDINFRALFSFVNVVLKFMSVPDIFIGTFTSWSCLHCGNILLINFPSWSS
jgi:hypothetical protein